MGNDTKLCMKCNNALVPGAPFCPHCGKYDKQQVSIKAPEGPIFGVIVTLIALLLICFAFFTTVDKAVYCDNCKANPSACPCSVQIVCNCPHTCSYTCTESAE